MKNITFYTLGLIAIIVAGYFVTIGSMINKESVQNTTKIKAFQNWDIPEQRGESPFIPGSYIGYRVFNGTLHMWNTKDNYYFNTSSGVQFTNHYNDYWTKNVFCIGYYVSGEWNKIGCADELNNFEKTVESDNLTYVNATLWKDIYYGGYNLRLAIRYSLKVEDENLTVTIYGKNLNSTAIPYNLGLAWIIKDIEIPTGIGNDKIFINDTDYALSGTYNLLFNNMSHLVTPKNLSYMEAIPSIRIYDYKEFLTLNWDKNLNYAVKMYGNGNQEDFYVATLINAGTFAGLQEKSTKLYWKDAFGDYTGLHWDTGAAGNTNPYGATCNDTNILISDAIDDYVYKWSYSGAAMGNFMSVTSQMGTGITVYGIGINSTSNNDAVIWAMYNANDYVYKYWANGSYSGAVNNSWTTEYGGTELDPTGLTSNGTHVFIADGSIDEVLVFDHTGVHIRNWTTKGYSPGIGYFNHTLYVVDNLNDHMYLFSETGTSLPGNFTLDAANADAYGVAVCKNTTGDITYIWVTDDTDDEVYIYEGMPVAPTPIPNNVYVTLYSPVNYKNYSGADLPVNFMCTSNSTSSMGILNLSLVFLNSIYVKNVTNTSAVQNLTLTDSWNIGDTSTGVPYNWTCASSSAINQTIHENWFFTVDTINPEINITLPSNKTYTTNYTTENKVEVRINWTYTETNPKICKIYNNTGNTTVTCNNYNYTMNTTFGSKDFYLWINDTVSYSNSSKVSVTYDYKIFEHDVNYSLIAYEGSIQSYSANVTVGNAYEIDTAWLYYNNTAYEGTITEVGGNHILNKTLNAELVNIPSNMSVIWALFMTDGTAINLSSRNQTIKSLNITACILGTPLYNFTLYDEATKAYINDTENNTVIEVQASLYTYDQQTLIYNFSYNFTEINPGAICISNLTLGTDKYSLDVIVRYDADEFEGEYYNIVNKTITNNTKYENIPLYDLVTAQSTQFRLTFKDTDNLPVEGALIYINRQYIADGDYKTVELPQTDSLGQTILHLVRNQRIYNIIVMKDGVIRGTYNNIMPFCADYTIGSCEINLLEQQTNPDIFNYETYAGATFTEPTYNNATKKISFSYVSIDGTAKTFLMEVSRNDIFGNKTLCNDTLTAVSGTLSCTLPSGTEDTLIIIKVYSAGKLLFLKYINMAAEAYEGGGYVFFVFILAFTLMFAKNKNLILLGILLGFIASVLLGVIQGQLAGYGSAGIWLIVAVAIMFYKLNKNKEN